MTFLYFRVIFYPAPYNKPDRLLIETIAKKCGFQIKFMKRIELGNKSDVTNTNDLDSVVYVFASDGNTLCKDSHFLYVNLSEEWCQHSRKLDTGERPMLQFYENRCFSSTTIPIQYGIRMKNIHFGVYPKAGEFLSYEPLNLFKMENGDSFTANFSHDLRELEIVCSTRPKQNGMGVINKVMIIPYKQIRNIIVDIKGRSNNEVNLFLDLQFPPLFYVREENFGNILESPKEKLTRTLPFGDSKNIVSKSNVILLSFFEFSGYVEMLSCLRRNCRNMPVHYVAVNFERRAVVPKLPIIDWQHFGCSYMMTALLNRNSTILEQDKNFPERLDKVSTYCSENGDCLENALRSVLFISDSGRFVNYWDAIDLFYSYFVSENSKDDLKLAIPPKCRLIRRITLTPTKMFLWPADLMSENRILRNFDSDYVLRVSFRDDDFFSLNIRHYEKEVLNEVIQKCITNGLEIGSRVYKLLAWSSSQLREHGVTMYATDAHGRSASDIIRWTEMDPQTTMNIPKCLARIGQCFSQTEKVCHVPLDENHIELAEDINGGLNPITGEPYCFSDGIGKISPKLVPEIEKATGEKNKSSAFQIRYAGCKGMLVIDPYLVDKDIVFRNSMLKYNCQGSEHTNLEIAKKSKPLALRLNRPLIAILNDLGVPNTVFLRLQEKMMRKLINMLLYEQEAVNCLDFKSNFKKFEFTQLSKSGIALTVEPFFRTFLLSLHKHFIDDIKKKASIEIDPGYGRNMFGVLDETGKLEYGQVFVQYSRDMSKNESTPEDTIILKGTVMVTKCPCVHPADVRKFTAVDIPELHHIVDCIVFPQKGPRPHSNEMAGSDLDGDEYAVIWLKELFFSGDNAEAPNYRKPFENKFKNVRTFLKASNTKEVAKFFMEYVQNDAIGKIAYDHLAFADKYSIFDPICLKIAEKHSFAVDFAKTGYIERLKDDEIPDEFPDFMDKFWKKKYKSKKVLGKMFRISKDFESENDVSSLEYSNIQVDSSLCVDGWKEYEEAAVSSRNAYNRVLKMILDTYGISHETEAFGGSFLKLHERFRERRDRADIAKIVNQWLVELINITRRQFFGEYASNGAQSGIELDEYHKKASAWYIVTYRKNSPEFLSFPWTVSDVLASIRIVKYENSTQSLTPRYPLIDKIDASITQVFQSGLLPRLPNLTLQWLNKVNFTCDRSIMERAISALKKWAEEEHILPYGNYSSSEMITFSSFIYLILSTAMSNGYISNPKGIVCLEPSASAFCICFLRSLRSLRFISKMETKQLFPAILQDIRILVKRASTTLHNIALTGKFEALSHGSCASPFKVVTDNIEMQPVSIDSSVLGASPIPRDVLNYASKVYVVIVGSLFRRPMLICSNSVDEQSHAPSNESNQLLIEKIARECGFQIIFMERIELGNKSDVTNTNDLDSVVYVFASDGNTLCKDSHFLYVNLSEEWCQHSRKLDTGERPMLQFYENQCFSSSTIPIQYRIRVKNIHFGVYPKAGKFLSYEPLNLFEMENGDSFIANFSHDLRELEIVCSTKLKKKRKEVKNKVMIIPYKQIRNIIVDVKDRSKNQVNLFLDLEFPPLFYVIKKEKMGRALPFRNSKNIVSKCNVILLRFFEFSDYVELLSCLRRNCRNMPVHYVAVNFKRRTVVPELPIIDWQHFGCSYTMTALLNRNLTILEQDKNFPERLDKVSAYCSENGDSLEKALRSVLFILDSGRFLNYWDAIDQFYSYFVSENSKGDLKLAIPPKCRLIRRITLTPTKMFLWPADLMSENRILRNFDSEYVLRVSFRDDDLLSLNIRRYEKEVLNEVIQKYIINGLAIGSRVYKLLAWSSSQLREHGVTMYATDAQGRSASDIIRWTEMDPQTTMNIPKCLARIGQCFSQTEKVCHVPLDENHIELAEDINGGLNPITGEPYCFSDGIGKISPKLVPEIEKATGEKNKSSAFQIRYAGCKGMLVVDPHLVDKDIVFRKSMRKYECWGNEHTNLEIAKRSKPLALRLNRPLIAILNDLEVPNTVFLKLQEQMIQKLIDMLLDEQEAVNCLNFRSSFRKFHFTELSQSGVALTVEPFFRTFLLSLHKHFIGNIKRKASIEIDPDYGRNMFGVLDETGKLEYGQVFIQYSRDISKNESTPEDTKVLEGTVMVTKCPCVHPADVRKFTAVDIPELHHIVDCIVFPQKGPRPHPDEISGSDLDGDEYSVIWMKDLFFNCQNIEAPNYQKPPAKDFRNVKPFLKASNTKEVAKFFMEYVQNDGIGKIAYAHLAFADKYSVFHPICLKIAEKHSFAVDFAKTGYFERLENDEIPNEFPDFMDKFWKKKYKSKKVLGKMFRISKNFESENDVSLKYSDIQVDSSLCVDGWEKYEESAVSSRNAYNRVLKMIMDTYGISHETEAFGGSFLKLHERFREKRDRADIAAIVNKWLVELINITRRQFFGEYASNGAQSGIELDEYHKKASAWYIVTYRKNSPEFLSFPWAVSDVLASIRILRYKSISQIITPRIPLIEKIDASITQICQSGFLQQLPDLTLYRLNQLQFTCDRRIIERAISVLTKWAEEEHILSDGSLSYSKITYDTFIFHILHTAMFYGNLSTQPSSAAFCICFFIYLRRLWFISKMDLQRLFQASLQDIRLLIKRASTTLHNIALTGEFQYFSGCNYSVQIKK
ncbi:unnamed protein product [Larinioides sclopetarius]|uniref:RNA-directed RNA polymerase n=1 Tax=Larinioides sclopetarius TaxID=280406 RepID=A0AAV1YUG2_9ARAC